MSSEENRFWLLLKTGWQFAGKYRPALIVCTVLFMAAQAVALLEPYVLGLMLNSVQADLTAGNNEQLLNNVLWFMSLFCIVKLGFWVIHGPTRLLERHIAFHIAYAYKSRMFEAVTNLPLKWQRQHHSGETIDKVNRATSALSDFFQGSFELVYMVCRLVGTLIILQFFMPLAAVAVIVTSAIALYTIVRFDDVLSKQYDELNKKANYIAEALHDYITNIVTVITLRLQPRTHKEVNRRMMIPLALFTKNNLLNEVKWCVTSLMIVIMTGLVMVGYTYSTVTAGGVILAGTLFALFDYLRRIGDSFYNFASQYGRVVRQAADLKAANSILTEAEALPKAPKDATLPEQWKALSISDINFAYQDAKDRRQHLQAVGLELRKGKSIAVVGPSGSGKSTLLRLLRGLDTADGAKVLADGAPLAHGLVHLNDTTTLMPQDPEIFADTIRFNITFGLDATEDEVMEAVRAARFDEVLARLPEGLKTNIAEKGVNLSGGEKQRLALARGIFFGKDRQILLLDEPTSSVDTANELAIYTNLLQRYDDRCFVSTIHKLHLLEMFDHIIVLNNGKVVESGRFSDLVAANGMLAGLWAAYQAASNSKDESK